MPEQCERSMEHAHLCGYDADVDDDVGGGLKPFRSDSLERSNLLFFHGYFQIYCRRPGTMCKEAGCNICRKMVNDEAETKYNYYCKHCGKGYKKNGHFAKHQRACKQAPDNLVETTSLKEI